MQKAKSISQRLYDRFQLAWMINHGFTVGDLVAEVTECAGEIVSNDEPLYAKDVLELFEETGFRGGSLYPCYHEFLDSEYRNASDTFPLVRTAGEMTEYVRDVLKDAAQLGKAEFLLAKLTSTEHLGREHLQTLLQLMEIVDCNQ